MTIVGSLCRQEHKYAPDHWGRWLPDKSIALAESLPLVFFQPVVPKPLYWIKVNNHLFVFL